MSIVYRDDSDGVTHQLWAQRQMSSCAVASIWMARNQARQMTFQEQEWALAWRMYHEVVKDMDLVPPTPAPMSMDPGAHQNNQQTFGNMFTRAGTFMGQVEAALRNDGLRVVFNTGWRQGGGQTVDSRRLSDTTPGIVLLGWYRNGQRRGGHFIVASRRTRRGKIVYLDPWEGVLSELNNGPGYGQTGSFEQVIYISA